MASDCLWEPPQVRRAAVLLAAACGSASLKETSPRGFARAADIFRTLRASRQQDAIAGGPAAAAAFLTEQGASTKPEIRWELERARRPSFVKELAMAEHARQALESEVCAL